MWVETESQKGILIGHQGRMIKSIGTAARKEIERELAEHVHLDLQRARAPVLARRRRAAGPARDHVVDGPRRTETPECPGSPSAGSSDRSK